MPKTPINKFTSWNSYYTDRPADISNLLLHWQYLVRILSVPHQNLLEIGCGPAEHSLFLKLIDPSIKLSLLDQDKKILDRLKKTHPEISTFYHLDVVSAKAIAKLPNYDLIISQGLMEHFSDTEFIQVINNFSTHTQKYIFSIPSDQYQNQDFGNEILRSQLQMQKLLSRVNRIKYKVYPYLDIGFRTKLQRLKSLRLSGLFAAKYLLTSSLHLLVDITYI